MASEQLENFDAHYGATLQRASERLAAAKTITDIVGVLRDTAREAIGAQGIAVILRDGERCNYVAEDSESPLWQGLSFPLDDCISGISMREGTTIAIEDVRLDPRIPQEAYAPTFVRSLVIAPIGRPEPVAALGAYWSDVRAQDPSIVTRLEGLARLATIAVENARLLAVHVRAASLTSTQNKILKLAVQNVPLPVALETIVREVENLSGADVLGSILLVNPDGSTLRTGAAPSLPETYTAAIEGLPIGPNAGSCGTAVFRKQPVFVNDIAADSLWSDYRRLALGNGLRACWSLPIMSSRAAVLGTFSMYSRQAREPTPADLEIAELVVNTVSLLIERSMAEVAIHRSEARYRQIVEGNDDFAIVSFDAHGTITGWNTGAERIIGHPRTEVLGQKGDLFYTPEDRSARIFEGEMRRAAQDGRAENERWHLRKDGTAFWGSGLLMPLAMDHGGFVKVFRDRTTEHAAEAAVRESEIRFRFFDELESKLFSAQQAADAMRAATEMLGLRLSASRCAYADVDHDNDRFWIRNDFTAPGVGSSVGVYSLNLFGPRAVADMRAGRLLIVNNVTAELGSGEGRETFQAIGIEAIICCPLIKHGRLTAMMAVHQELARTWTDAEIALVKEVVERCWAHVERVGSEARLRENEERLRLAVDNADVGFWDVDVINDVLIWPPRTKAMFGISADVPVTMQDFYEGLHPDDLPKTAEAYLAAADPQQRSLYDVEYRTIGKEDGVTRWVAAKGRGVFDGSGRCLRVAGTAVEITARKQAEEALRELNATLEVRVTTAVAEREQAQEALRQSQKMEAMGQLTGGVAHDFNNLLTPIVGTLDLLQRRSLGGEREKRLIAGAAESADRARTLVQRLLAFARRQPLQMVPVDVVTLVNNMGGLISSTLGPQIRVSINAPNDLPPAIADPNQLEMALLNLAVNARDAMPDGGALEISAREESISPGHRTRLRAGSYVCLSVADNGSGMDQHTLSRAVEPFFSTKGVGKGTGLGLSMVHGLASQLNGALTIRSKPQEGTVIELFLPRSSAQPFERGVSASAPDWPAFRGNVLLVDDEDVVRASTADMLLELGYEVTEAASGEDALRTLEEGKAIDLVITDHLMPGMSGTDLARVVHQQDPDMPVLLVSGYAEQKGISADLPRLTKPFRKDELAISLAQLDPSKVDRSSARPI